jgi:ATP-dependent DNA helicase RecQ
VIARVLIVAKTRQGGSACIGGLTSTGKSVRLIAPDAATNEHTNLEYNVGDVWRIDYAPAETLIPPHVENILVWDKNFLEKHPDPISVIHKFMPPKMGGVDALYEGLAQAMPSGALFVSERTGLPSYSTMFWQPDRPLARVTEGRRIRYRYATADGGYTLTFVGFQEPLETIPEGALVRVSLAHHWRPPEKPDDELRCFVQLSGWFLPTPRRIDAIPGSGKNLPDFAGPREVLRQIFGYDEFRPLQQEIIDNILQRRDSLVVMPTGGGKSLCYQVPALLLPGLTLVVSPLIALMQDQVDQLRAVGAPAAFLNSTLDHASYVETMQRVRRGQIKLLYVAPETLLRPETLVMLAESRLSCLAIDEAHCISEWGHDFRPEYRQLIDVRRRFPQAVCMALTATATPRVQADVKTMLGFSDDATFVASFDRQNLFLAVAPRRDGLAQALALIAAHPNQSGIIYCSTREQVDTLVADLVHNGVSALPYHAGLEASVREQNQRRFIHDDVHVMVATIAFGMGINKPDVRFILHYNLPSDLETYYQQVGRAGRDGLRADCLLLYSARDVHTILHFIAQGAEGEARGRRLRLEALVRWAESSACRRRQLLAYFGERETPERCSMCDICVGQPVESAPDDLTVPAQMFLSCMVRTREQFGMEHILNILRGSRAQKVLRWHHDQLPTYGIGAQYSERQWQHLAQQFLSGGLVERNLLGILKLTPRGRAVLRGEEQARGSLYPASPRATGSVAGAQPVQYDMALFERLRALRRELAEAAGVPPYVIFHDRTLQEMATYYPQSVESLAHMHGVGQRKLDNYADPLLEVIRGYCADHGITERARNMDIRSHTPTAPQRAPRITQRTQEIVNAYAELGSLPETARCLEVTATTVLYHLLKYVDAGNWLEAEPLRAASQLSAAQQEDVLAAFARLGVERLGPLFEAFDSRIPYEELHLLRLYYRLTSAQ